MKSGGLYREYVRAFYQGNNDFAANYNLLFGKIKVKRIAIRFYF
jgi:hypothetical protein